MNQKEVCSCQKFWNGLTKGIVFQEQCNKLMKEIVKQDNGNLETTGSDHTAWAV